MLVETRFLASGNHFLPLSQIFFKEFFIPASGNTFFSLEEKVLFFLLRTLFSASGNHYLNYREAYLKLLSLLLATIFFDFSDISANVSSFFSSRNEILNKFSIPAIPHSSWFSVYLIFCLLDFLLGKTIGETHFLKNNLIPASRNWFSG